MKKKRSSDFAKKLTALIDEYIIGDIERALFDLEPLPKHELDIRKSTQKDIRKEIVEKYQKLEVYFQRLGIDTNQENSMINEAFTKWQSSDSTLEANPGKTL